MPEPRNKKNKPLKWHQRWWGVMVLVLFVIALIYLAVFIYYLIILIETKSQLAWQDSPFVQNLSQNPVLSINNRQIAESQDDPFWGPAEAGIVIVEFSDFQCPFSKTANPIVQQIREEYNDSVKIIYRDFPNVASHSQSLDAAIAAECAADQNKFWAYHDLLFINQADLSTENLKSIALDIGLDTEQFNQCLDGKKYSFEVLNDLEDGAQLGISGTPAFFINGNKIEGAIPYDTFKEIIERALILEAEQNN